MITAMMRSGSGGRRALGSRDQDAHRSIRARGIGCTNHTLIDPSKRTRPAIGEAGPHRHRVTKRKNGVRASRSR
ncbi:hypothetical protein [Bradyrhizobium sp. SZCCHNS2022]|uniref:hypothetical protein n=1 Tax=unclassified Bradyrhizobium TaxID=2631580 RepID=UPI00396567F5